MGKVDSWRELAGTRFIISDEALGAANCYRVLGNLVHACPGPSGGVGYSGRSGPD